MKRKTITEEEVVSQDADETEAGANEGVALFDMADVEEKKIDRIHIHRKDPAEGFLGEMEPGATEADIVSRFGGSEYRLEGKNAKGQVVKVRSLRIAGDPIFQSDVAEARWRKQNGLRPRQDQQSDGDKMSVKDLLLLMEERDEKRRREERDREDTKNAERERREADERRVSAEREDRTRRDQEEREERRRKELLELEDRRVRQQREDDERRSRQHKEDLERMRADTERLMGAQGQMFQQTIALMKADAVRKDDRDPIEMMLKGITLAKELGGGNGNGEPEDVLTTLIKNGPAILSEARETARAAYREVTGKPDDQGTPAQAGGEDSLTITGPTASRVKALVHHLAAQGKDPEKVIAHVAALLMKKKGTAKPPAPPARKPRKQVKAKVANHAPKAKPKQLRPAPVVPTANA